MILRKQFKTDKQRWGAAAVELALVLPIFLMVVWGIVEFGRAMMVGQLVTNAARHGARFAVVDGSTNTEVTTAVKDFLRDSVGGIVDADITVTIVIIPAPGNPDPANQVAASTTKDICKITASIPYSQVGYIAGSFLNGANLSGSCSMRHE